VLLTNQIFTDKLRKKGIFFLGLKKNLKDINENINKKKKVTCKLRRLVRGRGKGERMRNI
jgi:hypothetical protein